MRHIFYSCDNDAYALSVQCQALYKKLKLCLMPIIPDRQLHVSIGIMTAIQFDQTERKDGHKVKALDRVARLLTGSDSLSP